MINPSKYLYKLLKTIKKFKLNFNDFFFTSKNYFLYQNV